MPRKDENSDRRAFLARLGAGATVLGAGAIRPDSSGAQSVDSPWRPARHAQDDWLERVPGRHRVIFDTTNPGSLESALRYANNYFTGNQNGYGLKDSDLAVVIVLRHDSTAFAYNDSIWAKYGGILSEGLGLVDPKTQQPPRLNVHLSGDDAPLDRLTKRGVQLAVCQLATRRRAGLIALAKGGSADTLYAELVANLAANAHIVPAGIIAVARAQERGYALAPTG
jgi:intracellular sulfur oxidation DsrE/DsrF family protein